MNLPLNGIRVIDFSWMLAGPSATRSMADFGAQVIKVQSVLTATGMEQNETYLFAAMNRNKLGITLNMAKAEAGELLLRLLAISDVLVQNFSPRVMENWGLSYDSVKEQSPSLIMLNLSGFGATGPWRNYAAVADTVQSLSGLTRLSASGPDSGEIMACPYADMLSGMFALVAVLAALEERRKSGRGANIDLSEFEAICSSLGPALLDYAFSGAVPHPWRGGWTPGGPFQGCYRCKGEDRWVVIQIDCQAQWDSFCRIMGSPGWSGARKYSTLDNCKKYKQQVDKYIQSWSIEVPAKTLLAGLRKARIPCSLLNDANDLAHDPQLRHRGYFVEQDHPALGRVTVDNTALRLSRTPALIRRPAPLPGQDNDYVFKTLLKLGDATIRRYRQGKIIY